MARTASRHLSESFAQTAPLPVDREAGVIKGVRVLGPESKNTYGVRGVDATEYSTTAHADACRLYEGITVNIDHIRDKRQSRSSKDSFGILRNARTVTENGQPVTYADLHYLKSHEMAARVCEDVERSLGVYGLSHDAYAGKERVDKARKRLVIEGLKSAQSVDLVYKPATNRNLWESEDTPVKTTFRAVLESHKPKTPKHAAWVTHLLEMDDDPVMGAEAEVAAPDADDALESGFMSAIMAVIQDDSLDASGKAKKIAKLLKAHEKLKSDSEPESPSEESEMPTEDKKESTDELAVLRAELDAMKLETAVRRLCEAEKFPGATPVQIKALSALPTDADRKALIADLKPKVQPRSGFRPLTESTTDKPTVARDVKSFVSMIRG